MKFKFIKNIHKNFEQQEAPKFSVSQNYIVCALKHRFIILEQNIRNESSFSTNLTPETTPTSPNGNIDLTYYEPVATGGESGRKYNIIYAYYNYFKYNIITFFNNYNKYN